ncbi:tail fiber assembly protein [Sulfitobacter sp. 915]|jgi:hypothetical protein|uniref:tail fiber assembly protein n=1 Tax=Sulfitobacter sp. 915 TaxID=3368558 RepID=UPI00374717F5
MKQYAFFYPESGDIVSVCEAPDGLLPPEGPLDDGSGLSIYHSKTRSVCPDKDRILSGRVVRRPQAMRSEQENNMAWAEVRYRRYNLLAASDWTQMPDSPHTPEQREAWAVYRQALRDLPENTEDPAAIVWPQPPT